MTNGAGMNIDEIKVHLEYIRSKIDSIDTDNKVQHEQLFSKINELTVKVAEQRIKSGFIGAITGAIPASIVALFIYLRSLPK